MSKSYWIAGAINPKHKGDLRRTLGAKKGRKIPRTKLLKAAKGGGVTAKRARLALTLSTFKHKK